MPCFCFFFSQGIEITSTGSINHYVTGTAAEVRFFQLLSFFNCWLTNHKLLTITDISLLLTSPLKISFLLLNSTTLITIKEYYYKSCGLHPKASNGLHFVHSLTSSVLLNSSRALMCQWLTGSKLCVCGFSLSHISAGDNTFTLVYTSPWNTSKRRRSVFSVIWSKNKDRESVFLSLSLCQKKHKFSCMFVPVKFIQ